jgi:hypothetical protein
VDPSTTNNFFNGKLREEASFSIFSLSVPSGSWLPEYHMREWIRNQINRYINVPEVCTHYSYALFVSKITLNYVNFM